MIDTVSTDIRADNSERAAIRQAFADAGFDIDVKSDIEIRSADAHPPWIVDVTLAAPIAAFFFAIGSKAGSDAYDALKRWAKGIWAARGDRPGSISVRDTDGTWVVIGSGLPDEALKALLELDWDLQHGGYLTWDGEAWIR